MSSGILLIFLIYLKLIKLYWTLNTNKCTDIILFFLYSNFQLHRILLFLPTCIFGAVLRKSVTL